MNAAFIICLCVPFTAGCQVTPTGMQHARTYAYVEAGRDEMRRSWIPGTRNQTGANHIRHCNVNEANEAHTHTQSEAKPQSKNQLESTWGAIGAPDLGIHTHREADER